LPLKLVGSIAARGRDGRQGIARGAAIVAIGGAAGINRLQGAGVHLVDDDKLPLVGIHPIGTGGSAGAPPKGGRQGRQIPQPRQFGGVLKIGKPVVARRAGHDLPGAAFHGHFPLVDGPAATAAARIGGNQRGSRGIFVAMDGRHRINAVATQGASVGVVVTRLAPEQCRAGEQQANAKSQL